MKGNVHRLCCQRRHHISQKLRYGGENSRDGVQCFAWDFALAGLFCFPFLEAEIKNQQASRIAYTENSWAMRTVGGNMFYIT